MTPAAKRKTTSGRSLTDNELTEIAREFEERELTVEEVSNIKKSRRRDPWLGVYPSGTD